MAANANPNPKEYLGTYTIIYEEELVELMIFKSRYIYSPELIRIDMETTDGEPFCTLSLNDPTQAEDLEKDEFIVKDYSENEGIWEQMLSFWRFQDTGKSDRYSAPIWRLLDSDGRADGKGAKRKRQKYGDWDAEEV